jgi:hypothetical protein
MTWFQWANLKVFVQYEIIALLAAIVLGVAHRLLTGSINTKGLLQAKNEAGGVSPARVQLLMLTGSVALYYLLLVLQALKTHDQPLKLPELPSELLFVLGGSHTLYLGSKAASNARNNSAGAPNQPTPLQ